MWCVYMLFRSIQLYLVMHERRWLARHFHAELTKGDLCLPFCYTKSSYTWFCLRVYVFIFFSSLIVEDPFALMTLVICYFFQGEFWWEDGAVSEKMLLSCRSISCEAWQEAERTQASSCIYKMRISSILEVWLWWRYIWWHSANVNLFGSSKISRLSLLYFLCENNVEWLEE